MIGKFWDAAGGKLADRWASAAGPAIVFWLGGLLAWVAAAPGFSRLNDVAAWLEGQTVTVQVAALLGALLVVLGSVLVVERATTPMLRLLEGYWPGWASRPRKALERRMRLRAAADRNAFQELNRQLEKVGGLLAGAEPAAQDALEAQLADLTKDLGAVEMRAHQRPAAVELRPTRTGNILRSTETRPSVKYGLDAVIVWPRLWLVLPDATRQEVARSRAALDGAAAAAIWGLAFCIFAPLAWWAVPAGLVVATAAVMLWVPNRAGLFADLVEAAYDLNRVALYQQLRWPLPQTPAEERAVGELLTQFLWRGSLPPAGFRFTSA